MAAVKINEINPKYENTRKIQMLLTNQNLKIIYQFHAHSVDQNSVEIFWPELYRGRLLLGPRYIRDDF
jgi:hypothetical protein